MSSASASGSPRKRRRWLIAAVAVPLVVAVIIAAGPIIGALITRGSDPPPTPPPPSPGPSRITAPVDGFPTTNTKLDVTAAAPPPPSGHHWYLMVRPGQSGVYFHEARSLGNEQYLATVGTGPAGDGGKGTYVISLTDVNDAAVATITKEMTDNSVHYIRYGMPQPTGAVITHSIKIIRTG